MRYKYSLTFLFTALLMVMGLTRVAGQSLSNTFYCSGEMSRIEMALKDTAHVSFKVTTVTAYNNGTTNTLTGQYKVSGNQVHLVKSDSTEFIQNSLLGLNMRHAYQRAELNKPVELFTWVLRAKLTDPEFYRTYVTGMAMADTGGYKRLSYQFKTASPYQQYDILYDPATHRIHAIQYTYSITGSAPAPAGSKMPFQVTMQFSNYQTGSFTDEAFSTDGYFTVQKGIYSMVPPYTSYKFINPLNQ